MSSFDRETAAQLDDLQKIVETLRAAHVAAMEENKYLIGLLNAMQAHIAAGDPGASRQQQMPHRSGSKAASNGHRSNSRDRSGNNKDDDDDDEDGESLVIDGNYSGSEQHQPGHHHSSPHHNGGGGGGARHRDPSMRRGASFAPGTTDPMALTTGDLQRSKQSWRFFYTSDRAAERSAWARVKDLELELKSANDQLARAEKVERHQRQELEHVGRVLKGRLAASDKALQAERERSDALAAEVRALKQEILERDARQRRDGGGGGGASNNAINLRRFGSVSGAAATAMF